jgi:MFS family permease
MWVAIPAVAIVGLCTSIAGIAIQSSIQLATDHAMRGRVMGLYGLIFRGAPAVGALAAGAAAAYFRAAASDHPGSSARALRRS